MINTDEAALVCDFAETYHIYDFRSLPARLTAVYACGLGQNSRIMKKLGGAKASIEVLLLATIADCLKILIWQNTVDGSKGRNKPESILKTIIGEEEEEPLLFDTPDDFRAWREQMLGGNNG